MGNEGSRARSPGSRGFSQLSPELKEKFERGYTYYMKIVIRGARGSGKTSLFNRLQLRHGSNAQPKRPLPPNALGHGFNHKYVPTPAIQATSIHWDHEELLLKAARPRQFVCDGLCLLAAFSAQGSPLAVDGIMKVDVWDVVDEGLTDKDSKAAALARKFMLGSKKGPSVPNMVADATTVDVYKNTDVAIFMFDATDKDSFQYVLDQIPQAYAPLVPCECSVVVVGNFLDRTEDICITANQMDSLRSRVSQQRQIKRSETLSLYNAPNDTHKLKSPSSGEYSREYASAGLKDKVPPELAPPSHADLGATQACTCQALAPRPRACPRAGPALRPTAATPPIRYPPHAQACACACAQMEPTPREEAHVSDEDGEEEEGEEEEDMACAKCGEEFGDEGGIDMEGRYFHRGCFKCWGCGEGIEDNDFLYTKDKAEFYHGDCFRADQEDIELRETRRLAIARSGPLRSDETAGTFGSAALGEEAECAKCGKGFDATGGLDLEGHYYHRDCFTCWGCDTPISDEHFVFTEDAAQDRLETYHQVCYDKDKADITRREGLRRVDQSPRQYPTSARGFKRTPRHAARPGGGISGDEGDAEEEDFICAKCGDDFDDAGGIHMEGKFFHKDCFDCWSCDRPIDINDFMATQDKVEFHHGPCYAENKENIDLREAARLLAGQSPRIPASARTFERRRGSLASTDDGDLKCARCGGVFDEGGGHRGGGAVLPPGLLPVL
eukprot:gene8219-1468_t